MLNAGAVENHEARYWNDQITLDNNEIRVGTNVLAVRVSNSELSSDIYFDAEVTIEFNKVVEGTSQLPATNAPPPLPTVRS